MCLLHLLKYAHIPNRNEAIREQERRKRSIYVHFLKMFCAYRLLFTIKKQTCLQDFSLNTNRFLVDQ